jgi:hypothetical protein
MTCVKESGKIEPDGRRRDTERRARDLVDALRRSPGSQRLAFINYECGRLTL